MGWVDDLLGQLVGLDTAPLIYYLETHPTYQPLKARADNSQEYLSLLPA